MEYFLIYFAISAYVLILLDFQPDEIVYVEISDDNYDVTLIFQIFTFLFWPRLLFPGRAVNIVSEIHEFGESNWSTTDV